MSRLIDRPFRPNADVLAEMASDPRLRPMVEHHRNQVIAERASCVPEDEPEYDRLLADYAHALGETA